LDRKSVKIVSGTTEGPLYPGANRNRKIYFGHTRFVAPTILENNMKRIIKTAGSMTLVAWAVMSSAYAATDEAFWFVGGNYGRSSAKIDQSAIMSQLNGSGLGTSLFNADVRSSAFKLLGGYQFNKNFALEGGYYDLGKFGYTATTSPSGSLTGDIKLRGLNLDAVGMLPINDKFSALGRLGLIYTEAKDNFASSGAVATPTTPSPSKNAINFKAGVGLQYNLTESLGLRAEAERYRIDDAVGSQGDVNMYSLGLVYQFHQSKPAPVEKVVMQEPIIIVTPAPPAQTVFVMAPPKKVVFSADSGTDALFDFGKYKVKPTGERSLDKFADDLKGAKFEVITITGHTDRIGSKAANMKLSTRRAEAVKTYLVEHVGIPAEMIVAKGVGGSAHMTKPEECKGIKATNKLVNCLAPDRRVEVEVVATRTAN
jgi:OOP family OmpA-OmpF porin